MRKLLARLLRHYLALHWVHWIVSWICGIIDTIAGYFNRLIGLGGAPPFFREWQSDRMEFSSPVVYPLADHNLPSAPLSYSDSRGTETGMVVFFWLPEEELLPYVPKELKFSDNPPPQDGKRPVTFVFGYQQDVNRAGGRLIGGENYLEGVVGFLNLEPVKAKHHSYGGPFIYLPRLVLNRFYPCILGWMVGYAKRLTRIATTENWFHVRTLLGHTVMQGSCTPYGERTLPDAYPDLQWLRTSMEKPTVTRMLGLTHLYVFLDWGWKHGWIQPIEGTIEITERCPGMPPGAYRFEGIDKPFPAPPGPAPLTGRGFRTLVPWEFVPPFLRSEIPPVRHPSSRG